jgi:hypothetical protein
MKNIRKIIPIIVKILKDYEINVENINRLKSYIAQKEYEMTHLLPLDDEKDVYIPISNLSNVPKGITSSKNSIVEQSIFRKENYISCEEIRQIINKEKSKLFNLENEIFIINELLNLIKRKYDSDL